MGAIGFVCEKTKDGVSFDKCLDCSREDQDRCQWMYPILKGIVDGFRFEQMMSITTILGCARKFFINKHFDYFIKIENHYWAFRGQIAHTIMEKHGNKTSIIEKRFTRTVSYTPLPGVLEPIEFELSGCPDEITDRKIKDWKFVAEVPVFKYPWKSHSNQLNGYNWMIAPHIGERDVLQVIYLDPKKTKPLFVKREKLEDVEAMIMKSLEPFYYMQVDGKIPSPKVQGDDDVLCGFCSVQDICHRLQFEEISQGAVDAKYAHLYEDLVVANIEARGGQVVYP